MITRPRIDCDEAAKIVRTGDTLIVGGFGMTGYPVHLIHALAEQPVSELTYIGNNVGEPGLGGGRLVRNGQIRRAIGSFFTSNREAVEAHLRGDMHCQLMPQGTLAEALRAGGAGLGGFYTPVAAGTALAEDAEQRELGGRRMVFVPAMTGDVAFVRAWRADTTGNLQYRLTENNFNHVAAMAASVVVAEVEEVVEAGELQPEAIHTPGCYIDYLVQMPLTEAGLGSSASIHGGARKAGDTRMAIATAALAELHPGSTVNLGVGIPTLIADLITPEHQLVLHSENGMLGVGPAPEAGGAMAYPVNASKIPVTPLPGTSYFDSAESFAMIRGGHIDVAVLGGLQVDLDGNLANWALPGKPLLGVGGAMDLASGARRLIVTMTHLDQQHNSKLVSRCSLPLTARGVVDTIVTDLATFRLADRKLTLTALREGVTVDEIRAATSVPFSVS